MDYVNDFSNENGFNEALQKVITNLHIYDGEYICLIERRMSQIYELARVFAEKLLFENGENIAEKLHDVRLCEFFEHEFNFSVDVPDFNRQNTLFAVKTLKEFETILLVEFIAQILEQSGKKIEFSDFFPNFDGSENIISFVSGNLLNKAYDKFSRFMSVPVFRPVESFEESCADVFDENAKMCILPIESHDGGQLTGFLKLLKKYELKILLTCSVQSGENKTRFALLGRNAANIFGFDTLTISIGATDREMIKIQTAAEFFNLEIIKIIKYPNSFSEGGRIFEYTLFGKEEDILKYLMYLEIETPKYNPIGLYKEIE